jgi:hypothetical protein
MGDTKIPKAGHFFARRGAAHFSSFFSSFFSPMRHR